jgi:WhiB family transcriptional regulator, redox-sensing transcriptional regulator
MHLVLLRGASMQVNGRREPAPEPDWRRFAACRDEDPDLFFPDGPDVRPQELQAVAVCMACPVMEACQRDSLADREMFGVWGGLTEAERHAVLVLDDARRGRLVGSAA